MSYSNRFLRDFRPVFLAILKEKGIAPAQLEVEIIDEEPESGGIFEPAGVRDVLEQLAEELNFLTILRSALHIFLNLQRQCMGRTGWGS